MVIIRDPWKNNLGKGRYMANSWLRHNGKRIFFMNFSECETVGDALESLLHAYQTVNTAKSRIIALFNFDSPVVTSRDFLEQFQQIAKTGIFKKKFIKSAVYGANGKRKVLTESTTKRFATRQEALNWLTSDLTLINENK
jgi:hypothetical protein